MKTAGITFFVFLFFTAFWSNLHALPPEEKKLPVRGLCIAMPGSEELDDFVKFIDEELSARGINTLILRIDYNYQYKSRPELARPDALTRKEVKKVVKACRKNDIRVIPQVNLLGHQSWAGTTGRLLSEYPEFDETPHVKMPEEYKWPNKDGLYCKSYCPLHPGVHDVVFDVVDEICEVFESDAFHAGMDEVFYIASDKCPRCSGHDPAVLFAGEVSLIRNHLATSGRELWIWGDRLIDGKSTGIGMWEASMNNTWQAIDMIPKDVFICDWHYERPDPTAVYFAMKGFRVAGCPWNRPEVAEKQLRNFKTLREEANSAMKDRYQGIIQTVWTSAGNFMDEYYGRKEPEDPQRSSVKSFKAVFRQ